KEAEEALKSDSTDKAALGDLGKAIQQRGAVYLEIREYEAACADFDRWIELYPRSKGAHAARGVARLRMADYKGALADFDQACVPNDPSPFTDAWLYRGRLKFELGDLRGALADLDSGIALLPKKWPPAYCSRGEIRAALGDEAGAMDDFAQAL